MSNVFRYNPEEGERLKETKEGLFIYNSLAEMEKKSNLPIKAWGDVSVEVFPIDKPAFLTCNEYLNNVVENVKQGKGLYIHGNAGNGKTTWAYKIARKYIATLAYNKHSPRTAVYFANVPELMNDLKLGFSDNEMQRRLNYSIENADLVIFDDIGAENSTDWAQEQLYHYINYRYANGKATIFTSNIPPNSLEKRIADRVNGMTQILEFKSGSQRGIDNR